jgi:hypothetical protein
LLNQPALSSSFSDRQCALIVAIIASLLGIVCPLSHLVSD